MIQKSFGRDEVIFREGSYDETMYEIVSGAVGVYTSYGMADQQELARFAPGQVFGEMGLVEFFPRSATAVSLSEDTIVNEIASGEFISYLEDQPERVLAILRQLTARIRETQANYDEACHTVYDAIEAEKSGSGRDTGLLGRLSTMISNLTGRRR